MQQKGYYIWKIALIGMLLFFQSSFGQLTNFTLTVVKTNETCTANGSLTFSVSNTAPGATMIYTIYHLPDVTTPISLQSTTTISGLVAGNYRVVATQILNGSTNAQQQDITILYQVTALTYQVVGTNVICGNDGKITVNITGGTAVNYELFAGPVTRPLQSSNVFTNLPEGLYSIRVFNSCNEGVVQNFQLEKSIPNIEFNSNTNSIASCNLVSASFYIFSGAYNATKIIAYPITIEFTLFPPTGGSTTTTQTLTQGNPNQQQISTQFPLYYDQSYSYNVKITDACGNVFIKNSNQIFIMMQLLVYEQPVSCAMQLVVNPINFVAPFTVTFLSAPPGFVPVDYNSQHPGPFTQTAIYTFGYPQGTYTIQVTDACGHSVTQQYTTQPPPIPYVGSSVLNGCQTGEGSVLISNGTNNLISVTIVAAPQIYQNPLPEDVSYNLHNGIFTMNSFPAGNYTFQVMDGCGFSSIVNVQIQGYQIISNGVNLVNNCNSFDIALNHQSTTSNALFYMQKWDVASSQWGNPITNYYDSYQPGPLNAIALQNNFTNLNFSYSGTFRIVKVFFVYANGSNGLVKCQDVIYTFEYNGLPKINAVYSFACGNGNYSVLVDAVGTLPLTYKITTKNGVSFIIDNGNSNILTGIAPGIYNFQVIDNCGNVLNSVFEIPHPFDLSITPTNMCEGQVASLSIPAFGLLSYQWWKDNNTGTILSTTNTLTFPSFNLANNSGTYHVRISYLSNPNSCIDFVIDYTVSPILVNPNAGQGSQVSYCGNKGVIDLFSLLTGNYDGNGTWTELTNSGFLNNNLWNSTFASSGMYQFKYSVSKCSFVDEAFVIVIINSIPQTPFVTASETICEGNDAQLFANVEMPSGYSFAWTGPNNFASTEQNPIIQNAVLANSGTYSVKSILGECQSEEVSIDLLVNPIPKFTLDSKCDGGRYILSAFPENASFDVNAVTYSWSGPNGFTSTVNPADITQLSLGSYSLTITDTNGCDSTESIEVASTFCQIPNVITPNNDNLNDTFDLSGLDVEKLEIYSRWGRKVYEKENYIDQWQGQNMHGGFLPDSTYYYYIKLRNQESKIGWVFLNRG